MSNFVNYKQYHFGKKLEIKKGLKSMMHTSPQKT